MLALFELIRPRQWAKNGFVLAPLFFGRGLLQAGPLGHAIAAFVVFCLIASAVYIFNDWRDLGADLRHMKKHSRPLPSGRIAVSTALLVMFMLATAAVAIGIAAQLPVKFFFVVGIYVAINIGYSLGLKHIAVLELFLVASGFVLRLLGGGVALSVELSPWIILATATIALLLTAGKRRGDIAQENDNLGGRRSLEGYTLSYLDAVLSAIVGSTLVIYLLFCVSDYAVDRYGEIVILTALPVGGGLLRYLQLVMVKGVGDAPTELVTKDIGMIAAICMFLAMFAVLLYIR